MTFRMTWITFIAISIIYLLDHIAYGEDNAPAIQTTATSTLNTTQMRKQSNRFLAQFFHKYGSRGTISFEGLEHLMHNLDIGGLKFPEKHTLDHHRQNEYNGNRADNEDDSSRFSTSMATPDIETSTRSATVDPANEDYLIKLLNTMNNEQQADVFRTMHDPSHRHPRHRGLKTCLSPISLIQIINPEAFNNSQKRNPAYRSSLANEHDHQHEIVNDHSDDLSFANIQITPTEFLHMCPALLLQIEQRSCAEEPKAQARGNMKEISRESWILAVFSVTIISLCGLVGVGMVPLTRFTFYPEMLRFMIAIAVGTLCGDALMHLLPHALNPHADSNHEETHASDHHESHDASVWLFGSAFLAALIMYAIESVLPLIGGSGHGHGHNHAQQPPSPESNGQSNEIHPNNCHQNSTIERSNYGSCEELDNDIENSKRNNEEKVMVKDTMNKVRPALTPVAFMVVIGDGLHNLTDGMAIGGAFASDPVTGLATAIAVLCHELPHELGDFALLLQTGVSLRRAIFFNIVSSVLCFMGMFIGLFIVRANGEFVRWIYSGTAGTFLYIAFADLVPELNRTKLTAKMAIINILGFLSGGVIMLLIALFEDDIKVLFH